MTGGGRPANQRPGSVTGAGQSDGRPGPWWGPVSDKDQRQMFLVLAGGDCPDTQQLSHPAAQLPSCPAAQLARCIVRNFEIFWKNKIVTINSIIVDVK